MDQSKTCTGCAETKPLAEYYAYKGKPQAQCKDCVKARQRAIRELNPLHRPVLPRDEDGKICPHCRSYKAYRHFLRPRTGAVDTYCQPCLKVRDREAKLRNAEAVKRYRAELQERPIDLTEVRRCPRCQEDKPRAEFSAHGRGGYCKPCRAAYARDRNRRLRDKRREERYGYTTEKFALLLQYQGGGCAICGSTKVTNGRWISGDAQDLHVDHDHVTGEVRGLLCNQCNVSLGLMGDDPDRLIRAAEYLKNHPAQNI